MLLTCQKMWTSRIWQESQTEPDQFKVTVFLSWYRIKSKREEWENPECEGDKSSPDTDDRTVAGYKTTTVTELKSKFWVK